MPYRLLVSLFLLLLCQGCLSYYQRKAEFNKAFEQGQFQEAEQILIKSKPKKKNQLLYFLNKGVTAFMQGEYQESNVAFEQAYLTAEIMQPEPGRQIASYFINPRLTIYEGEHHEVLLINYFKALNYLFLDEPREALVECRRMNIQLQYLNLKYNNQRHRYQADAFINLLMGLIYEANKDYNNAFIAYRNAYEIYKSDYQNLFGISAPKQLKADMIRTAQLSGLSSEVRRYQQQFSDLQAAKAEQDQPEHGTLVFLWHNGLGPVKDQVTLNFSLVEGSAGGVAHFSSEQYGWTIPYPSYQEDKEDHEDLPEVELLRLALPKYLKRPPYFQGGYLQTGDRKYSLPVVENITKLGFQVLEDRILRDLGKALARLAVKEATEYAVKEEDEGWGSVVDIANVLTEQADTRNWQTLPHAIHYAKVPLKPGEKDLDLVLTRPDGSTQTYDFTFNLKPGEIRFEHFHTLNIRKRSKYQEQQLPKEYHP